jgi:hypothetical protein
MVNQQRTRLLMSVATGLGFCALTQAVLVATPQYSRRYNLSCYACHTMAPALNEQGWMFKRLGHHLPPALTHGQPTPTISDLVKKEPRWSLTDNFSIAVADFAFQAQRTTMEGTDPVSASAFQVNVWNNYASGWIPDTNFFYLAEFDIITNGSVSPDLSNAYIGYAGGNARSSWFVTGGREHLQIAEGTRAAQVYSLMAASPLMFENPSPTSFVLDQSPVGVAAGYTWASDRYKNVLAATVKVTNGDNADGSEIMSLSNKNSKDVWFDADWWYAPESGITFLDYYGKKDQTQNPGADNEFTYRAVLRRTGIFANYMFDNKIDVLGGYLRSKDDWQTAPGVGGGYYTANDYYGEVNYFVKQGLALAGRYDLIDPKVTGGVGRQSTHQWSAAVNQSFTRSGSIIGRLSYSYLSGRDPLAAVKGTSRLFQADVLFNF